jgi:hypothetical protein
MTRFPLLRLLPLLFLAWLSLCQALIPHHDFAQDYLMKESRGETFVNAFAGGRREALFSVENPVEFFSSYDPNLPALSQLGGVALDAAAAGVELKAAEKILQIGGRYFVRLKNGTLKALDDTMDEALEIRAKRPTGSGEAGEVISRSENIPHTGSRHPDPEIQKNIEETMGYIFDDSKKPPKKIRDKWGNTFKNEDADLPTQTADGKFIEYKEYKARTPQGGDNVHRIVVGSDGKYYYTNTHYGAPDYQGIPFYEAGKLPKGTIEKIFKKDNK